MQLKPQFVALLARELNPEQQLAAASGPEQSLRIIAGPGTGKTKTLAFRFLALTAGRNLRPDAILALTFTEKAAAEMEERVKALLPAYHQKSPLWISTFHSFAARILQHEARQNNTENAATILNELDKFLLQTALFDEIMAEPDLGERYPALDFSDPALLARDVFAAIERLRDAYRSPEALIAAFDPAPTSFEEKLRRDYMAFTAHVYAAYRSRLIEKARLDFPEMVYRAYYALKDNVELGRHYQERFVHILVDEFQDTSLSQLEFLRLLSPELANVTVVGDRKQSIYGWRNAWPENFEDAALLRSTAQNLTRNYRSHQEILDAAATILKPLSGNKVTSEELSLTAHRGTPQDEACVIVARPADSVAKEEGLQSEAAYIVAEIARIRKEPEGAAKSIAILLRSVKTGSKPYEEALRQAGIDYVTVGGGGFYDQQEVRDLIALLRLLCDTEDGQAFYRLAASPLFRLNQLTLFRIAELARQDKAYIEEKGPLMERGAELFLQTAPPNRERENLAALLRLLNEGRAEKEHRSPAGLVKWVLESEHYQKFFESRPPGERAQTEANCEKLEQLAFQFEQAEPEAGLPELAAYLTLWLESNLPEEEAPVPQVEAGPNVVQIMTVHQSKGLEFDVVFVARQKPFSFRLSPPGQPAPRFVYLPDREDLFRAGFALLKYSGENGKDQDGPDYKIYRELEETRALEEERFVLYVALTRARSRLYVTSLLSRAVEQSRTYKTFFFRELVEWAEAASNEGRAVQVTCFGENLLTTEDTEEHRGNL
jgi:DNA helicase-2/ATP-dependent DNA helicase PcrA